MNNNRTLKNVMEYRQALIENGKRVALENPDRLNINELQVLVERILKEINEIDMAMGYESHDIEIKVPHKVNEKRILELYLDFIDWYDIIKTPSNILLDYIQKNYPPEQYKNILCIGDGKCSHLGRKLANSGYNAVSVDPLARREFSKKRDGRKTGKFHVVKGEFFRTSTSMIDWADLIVGAKVPQCAQELIGLEKETVFTISNNAEIYGMKFNGVPITSSKVLINEITKCKDVTTETVRIDDEEELLIFISKQRELEEQEL